MKEVRKKTGAHGDPVELAVALSAAQEQQAQLEQTLSSETKVKMDLFSALGGARRQLQINESEYSTTVYRLGGFASFWCRIRMIMRFNCGSVSFTVRHWISLQTDWQE
jgi:hypothetical protein